MAPSLEDSAEQVLTPVWSPRALHPEGPTLGSMLCCHHLEFLISDQEALHFILYQVL